MNGTRVRALALFACLAATALFMANARESEVPIEPHARSRRFR